MFQAAISFLMSKYYSFVRFERFMNPYKNNDNKTLTILVSSFY